MIIVRTKSFLFIFLVINSLVSLSYAEFTFSSSTSGFGLSSDGFSSRSIDISKGIGSDQSGYIEGISISQVISTTPSVENEPVVQDDEYEMRIKKDSFEKRGERLSSNQIRQYTLWCEGDTKILLKTSSGFSARLFAKKGGNSPTISDFSVDYSKSSTAEPDDPARVLADSGLWYVTIAPLSSEGSYTLGAIGV